MNNDCRALKPNHVSNPFKYDQLQPIGIQTIKSLPSLTRQNLNTITTLALTNQSGKQRLNPSNAVNNAQP